MSTRLRNALTILVVFAVSLVLSLSLTQTWSAWFVVDRTFTSQSMWWSEPDALDLMDESIILLAAGAMLALMLHVRHPIAWTMFLGIAFGVARWILGWSWIEPDAHPSVYFWVYGGYFLPTIGAIIELSSNLVYESLIRRRLC